MRTYLVAALLVLAVAFIAGCSNENVLQPEKTGSSSDSRAVVDPDLLAAELVAQSGWTVTQEEDLPSKLRNPDRAAVTGLLLNVTREPVVGDIVHYSFKVRVGSGRYDIIGLHRVVKEKAPYRPITGEEEHISPAWRCGGIREVPVRRGVSQHAGRPGVRRVPRAA